MAVKWMCGHHKQGASRKPQDTPKVHMCHLHLLPTRLAGAFTLQQRMLNFVQNIQYYTAFEVMEPTWHTLEKSLKSVSLGPVAQGVSRRCQQGTFHGGSRDQRVRCWEMAAASCPKAGDGFQSRGEPVPSARAPCRGEHERVGDLRGCARGGRGCQAPSHQCGSFGLWAHQPEGSPVTRLQRQKVATGRISCCILSSMAQIWDLSGDHVQYFLLVEF